MAFSDPIVGTEVLIRNQIQSENFSVDPESGVTGWQIKRDGTATFNQLVIGGPNFVIDQNGDAVFHSITLTAVDPDTAIILHGEDIEPHLYDNKAKGVISLVTLANNSPAYSGTAVLLGRIVLPNFDIGRQYVLGFWTTIAPGSTPTHTDTIGYITYAWDADPTSAGTQLYVSRAGRQNAGSTTWCTVAGYLPFQFSSAGGTDLRLALWLTANANGPFMTNSPGGVNRIWIEDIGQAITYQSFDASAGGGNPPVQYTKTYSASGSASYQGDDDIRSGVSECYQGQYSATNGNQYSVILFPYSAIATDLSGATINKVEVYLNNNHWYYNSGGTAIIGYHNSATTPSSFTYPSSTDNITRSSFTYGQAKWVTVANSIGDAFKNGTAKGILLGKGQTAGGTLSTDKLYYGYFAGNGQSGEPQLRITYTK